MSMTLCATNALGAYADAVLRQVDRYVERAKDAEPSKKEAALGRATKMLGRFLSSNPDDARASEMRLKQAKLLVERANLVAAQVGWADGQAKATLVEKAVGLYDDARKEAELAAGAFEKVAAEALAKAKKRRTAAGDQARAQMLESLLLVPWITKASAKMHEGTEDYAATVKRAATEYRGFATEHPKLGYTLQAYREAGLCYHELKEYDEALRCFRRVIRTRPIAETDGLRQLTYVNQAQSYNACGRHRDAVKAVSNMLALEWPDLLEEQAPVALAAKLEEAKGLAGLAEESQKKAAELRAQGDAPGAAKELADAKRRVNSAIQSAQEVAATGGKWGETANGLIAGWRGLLAGGSKRTADMTFSQAEAAYGQNELADAVRLYKETIGLARVPQQQDLVIEAWLKLGASHAKLKQLSEGAKAFGYVPRNFGDSPKAPQAAFLSFALHGQVYQGSKTREAAEDYLQASQFLVENYPEHPKASIAKGVIGQLQALLR